MPLSTKRVIRGSDFFGFSWFDFVRPGWRMVDRHNLDDGGVEICGTMAYEKNEYQRRELYYTSDTELYWLGAERWNALDKPQYGLWSLATVDGRRPCTRLNKTTLQVCDMQAAYVTTGITISADTFGTAVWSAYGEEWPTHRPVVLQSCNEALPTLSVGEIIDPIADRLLLFYVS